jgi:N-terminal domain of argonaute
MHIAVFLYFPTLHFIMLSRSGSTGSARTPTRQHSRSNSTSSNRPPQGLLFQSRILTGPGADYEAQYRLPTEFKTRPGYNSTGREVQMALNSFAVDQFPTQTVYQYDVQIGNGAEKRMVIKKVWETQARKNATGEFFIFDGNKLGWSGQNIEREIHLMVDLDAEQGRPPGRTSNSFRVVIRKTKVLDISLIRAYFNRQIQMGTEILEAISKLGSSTFITFMMLIGDRLP